MLSVIGASTNPLAVKDAKVVDVLMMLNFQIKLVKISLVNPYSQLNIIQIMHVLQTNNNKNSVQRIILEIKRLLLYRFFNT